MKKISQKILFTVCLFLFMISCTNRDWSFPDFEYTTSYFPWQYPVRTLILGEYDYDNTNDINGRFVISAAMGGVYENNEDVVIEFAIDESLTQNLRIKGTETQIKPLPRKYYTLSNDHHIIIPKGKINGGITVQLTDAFFEDPLAISTNYVIPLIIKSSTTDSILSGSPAIEGADRRDETQWKVAPKDFTLFGIKYINEYHGKYLLRGKSVTKDPTGAIVGENVYHQQYVEKDIVASISTSGRHTVDYSQPVRVAEGTSPGSFIARITVDDDGNCTIVNTESSPFEVTGTGKYVLDGDSWGGKQRNVFRLEYEVKANGSTYEVTDTLVYRDNGVAVEEFTPEIY